MIQYNSFILFTALSNVCCHTFCSIMWVLQRKIEEQALLCVVH